MKKNYWLFLLTVALGWFNAGVVWLIQFSCYPLWPYVGPGEFSNYHHVWGQSTWWVVFLPSVLVAAGSILLLRFSPPGVPRWAVWAGVCIQFTIQLVTAFWLSPIDRHIVGGKGGLNFAAYESLVSGNWVRIALVTTYAVLNYWVLARALWPHAAMTRGRWLLLSTSALGLYAVGNVWLVQLVCYRLWPSLGRGEAFRYHLAWWHSIWGVLFVPAGIVFLSALALPWLRPSGVKGRPVWLALMLQIVTYASTAAWWGPLMARLIKPDGEMLLHDYQLLMSTHWIRLALVTGYGLTSFYILIKSATAPLRSSP
jgi:hypothetical protein